MKSRYFKSTRSRAIWRFSDAGAHIRGINRAEWLPSVMVIDDMEEMGAVEITTAEGEP